MILVNDKTGASYAILHGRGRDLEQIELAFDFEKTTKTFILKGDAAEVAVSEEREMIRRVLKDAHPERLKPKQIYEALEERGYQRSPSNARHLLVRMVQAGTFQVVGNGKDGYGMSALYRVEK